MGLLRVAPAPFGRQDALQGLFFKLGLFAAPPETRRAVA